MPGNSVPSDRLVWLAVIGLAAVIVAAASGFVLFLARAAPATALAGAGTAFAVTVTLALAAGRFLDG